MQGFWTQYLEHDMDVLKFGRKMSHKLGLNISTCLQNACGNITEFILDNIVLEDLSWRSHENKKYEYTGDRTILPEMHLL